MEIRHRGNVRYGEPHLRDPWADYRLGPGSLAPTQSGVWIAASRLPLVVHVDHRGAINGPFALKRSQQGGGREIHGLLADHKERLWIRWSGGFTRFDPASGDQQDAELRAQKHALGEGAVWSVDHHGSVIRTDPETMLQESLGPVGRGVLGLEAAHGVVWVMFWDPEQDRTVVVRIDPVDGAIVGSTVMRGFGQGMLVHPEGVVARVWRRIEDTRDFDDMLIWIAADGQIARELVIAPTGVSAAVRGAEVWLSGHDPFDERSRGQPSTIRRLRADGDEELLSVSGTVDQLAIGPDAVWGRLDEQHSARRFGSVIAVTADGSLRATELGGVDVTQHLPAPPPAIDAEAKEKELRERLAGSLFGGWRATDPDTGSEQRRPYIEGVTIEDVRLEGSFPATEIVVLFRAESRPGVLFGRRQRVWDVNGEFSGVIEVMDVNLMEDVQACSHGLPSAPNIGPAGICWL